MNNLLGKRFGKLTVIERDTSKTSERGIYWITRCDCGTIKSIRSTNMITGRTVSCGCYNKEKAQEFDNESAMRSLYRSYQHNAKRRNKYFDLSYDYFKELIVKPCVYCSDQLKQTHRHDPSAKASVKFTGIDRVDNTQGYTQSNTVACCGICNRAKDTMTVEEFRKWATRVAITDPTARKMYL